ncbi:MAG: hypothetical protein ACLTQL_06985 [Eisenbergiella sp.]
MNYVIEQARFYGYSGERVRGLVFCSLKEEAAVFSKKFNERGFRNDSFNGSRAAGGKL